MNEDYLKSNTLVVQTLSPIHIGTDARLRRFDFSRNGSVITVLDENKVMVWVASDPSERVASDLTSYGLSNKPIGDLLTRYGRNPEEFAAYQIRTDVELGVQIREILPFIKTHLHEPYLPGSSLKGSLRSALLRGALLENPELLGQADRLVKQGAENRKSAGEDVQADVFIAADVPPSKRPSYDINRVLVLHDSQSKRVTSLEVVEIYTLSHQSDGSLRPKLSPRGDYPMAIYAETIRPKVSFYLHASWQTQLLSKIEATSKLKFESTRRLLIYMPEFCRASSLQMLAQELNFYHRHGNSELTGWFEKHRDLVKASAETVFVLPLGWGSGYDAKTVTDLLDRATFQAVADNCRNTEGLGRPGNIRSNPWLGPELSPKSRKVVVRPGKDPEPIGWVALTFRAIDENEADWLTQARKQESAQKPEFKWQESVDVEIKRPVSQPSLTIPSVSHVADAKVNETPPLEKPVKLPPPKRPLTTSFTALPTPQDRFTGTLSFIDGGSLFIEIPNLSAEDYALAVIKSPPSYMKFNEGDAVVCEVLEVKEDPGQSGHWLVYCALD